MISDSKIFLARGYEIFDLEETVEERIRHYNLPEIL
jgi:hypothetical protein